MKQKSITLSITLTETEMAELERLRATLKARLGLHMPRATLAASLFQNGLELKWQELDGLLKLKK